jgi:hypothetical protein
MFALGVSIHACFSDQNYVFLQFWYSNSANVHQSILGLDLSATQDNAAIMSIVGEFDLYDINQYLSFWIDSSPMSNETQWAGLTIQVKGTFLDYGNGSRGYSSVYNNTITVKPQLVQGVDRIEYFFNFSNEIQKVQQQVYPDQPLENIGIFGSLALDTTIHGAVGQVGTQNYVRLTLHADSESPYEWVFIPSITIPETAQWQIAKIDGVDMTETFPDIRETELTVTQGRSNDHQIYAAWQIPAPPSLTDLMTKFPFSLGWSFVSGLATGLIPRYLFDRRRAKKERQELKDRIREELEIILKEVTADFEKEAFQSRTFFTEGFTTLKQDLVRKLDAKTFRAVLETYIKIDQLRFPSNLPDVNRTKYKEAIATTKKTMELLE